MSTERQLTLRVDPHPRTRWKDGSTKPVVGAVKLSGALTVDEDLQPGDQLTVQVANADGEVIAHCAAEVSNIGFKLLEQSGTVIGTQRIHTAKVEL